MIFYFLIAFLIVYLFYLVTVVLQKKRMDNFKKSNQVLYFVKRYKLDVNKLNMTRFTNTLGLANAFIVATAFMTTFLVENYILMLLVGFIVLIPLILIVYHIIGKIYIRKGCVINGHE